MSAIDDLKGTIKRREQKTRIDKENLREAEYLMAWLGSEKAEAHIQVDPYARRAKVGKRLLDRIRAAVMEDVESLIEEIERTGP